MEKIIFIALGGGIGSALRYGITQLATRYGAVSLPYGTILANTIGSFCIGLLFVFFTQTSDLPPTVKLFFVTGILGGFTTFSTYNMELLTLVRTGDLMSAAAYFFTQRHRRLPLLLARICRRQRLLAVAL